MVNDTGDVMENGNIPPCDEDKIKSAIHHMAEGADEFTNSIFNGPADGLVSSTAVAMASAVIVNAVVPEFNLAAMLSTGAAIVGVYMANGIGAVTGIEASQRTKSYKDKLPANEASRWNNVGKGLAAAFALAGGIAAGMGAYSYLPDCQPETNSKQMEEQTAPVSYNNGAARHESNENKPHMELSTIYHGNTVALKV